MFLTSITACENRTNFLPCIYCAIWLVDFWPITTLVKYISVWLLCSPFSMRTTQIRALVNSTSCFIFPFWHLENNEINEKKFWKRPQYRRYFLGDWCSNRKDREIWWKTWRLQGKPGELAGMIRQSTPVGCYLQSVTLKCLFSTIRITVSSHNFKPQNYRGKYLLNLNNYSYIGICLHVISRIRLSSL